MVAAASVLEPSATTRAFQGLGTAYLYEVHAAWRKSTAFPPASRNRGGKAPEPGAATGDIRRHANISRYGAPARLWGDVGYRSCI